MHSHFSLCSRVPETHSSACFLKTIHNGQKACPASEILVPAARVRNKFGPNDYNPITQLHGNMSRQTQHNFRIHKTVEQCLIEAGKLFRNFHLTSLMKIKKKWSSSI